jgi:hypothetical protein
MSLPLKSSGAMHLGVAVSESDDSIVYVAAGPNVYKTLDGGNSWQAQETHTQGLANSIAVHPSLSQIAYVGIFTGQ